MNGFINSPALAKLVAMQMVDDQVQQNRRTRPLKAPRTTPRITLRARLLARRTQRVSQTLVKAQHMSPTRKLVEDV